MCHAWHAHLPPPCQVYEIAQSGFRPQTLTKYKFPFGPLDQDCTFSKEGEPMVFALVALNEDGLTDKEHEDYEERKMACPLKKWRWCASALLPHVHAHVSHIFHTHCL